MADDEIQQTFLPMQQLLERQLKFEKLNVISKGRLGILCVRAL